MRKEKSVEAISPIRYLINVCIITFFIFNLVLYMGNIAIETIEDNTLSQIVGRYIPGIIVGFVATKVMMNIYAKRTFRNESNSFIMFSRVAPVLVAIATLIYGVVNSNAQIEEYKKNLGSFSLYSSFLGEDYMDELVEKAKQEALIMWLITSALYAVGGVAASFINTNNILGKMIDEEVALNNNNNNMQRFNDTSTNNDNPFNNDTSFNNIGVGDATTDQSGQNNINWNL